MDLEWASVGHYSYGYTCADLEGWICDGDSYYEYYQDKENFEGNYYDDSGALATEACCACGGGAEDLPCDASALLPNAASVGDCGSSLGTYESCVNVGISGYTCTPSTCYFGVLRPGFCGGKMLPQLLFGGKYISALVCIFN